MSSISDSSVLSRSLVASLLNVPVPLPADGLRLSGIPVGSIQAGFPSPAEDHAAKRIDLIERLITHPQATYVMRVRGLSMVEAGIFDGDVVVVDRAIKPRHGQIVVAVVDGEFTVKYLSLRAGRLKLKAASPTFADIVPRDGQVIEVNTRPPALNEHAGAIKESA